MHTHKKRTFKIHTHVFKAGSTILLEYKVKDLKYQIFLFDAALLKLGQCFDRRALPSDSRTNEAHWFRKIGKRKFCGYGKHRGVVGSDRCGFKFWLFHL